MTEGEKGVKAASAARGHINRVEEGFAREGEGAVAGTEGMPRIASVGDVLSKSKKTIIVLALCVCMIHP